MHRIKRLFCLSLILGLLTAPAMAAPDETQLAASVQGYFAGLFDKLAVAAGQHPTPDTFRSVMKPLVEDIDGMYGATLIDKDFVIRQVYYKRNFLARGYDLKQVEELDYFWDLMRREPTPQLSEPGHGSLLQPRLIALRSPVMKNGQLTGVVSMMVRTEAFLEAVGLDRCQAYRITCRGKDAESEGELGSRPRRVRLELPANDWVIEYR